MDLEQNQVNLSLVPGTSGAGYTKELTDPQKISEFYQYMQGISFGVTIDENGVVQEENALQNKKKGESDRRRGGHDEFTAG